jgi:hypothetical protein
MLRKYVFTIVLFCLMPLPILAAEGKHDIRQFSWGDSIKQVTSKEKAAVFKPIENSAPLYTEKTLGIDTVIGYLFVKDSLQGAIYIFKAKHEKGGDYLKDYNSILDWLTKQYGKPKSANRIWKDEDARKLKASNESKWGDAINNSELSLTAEWSTPRMIIAHSMEKVSAEILHVVTFNSMALVNQKGEPNRLNQETPKAMKIEKTDKKP